MADHLRTELISGALGNAVAARDPEVLERAMAGRLNREEATAHFGGLNLSSTELR